jgi:hypothetical protein
VVLSGDLSTREAYRWETGREPSIAMNGRGEIVEVHADIAESTLCYWTGKIAADGTVRWKRRGNIAAGRSPGVALSKSGWVVLVHEDATGAKSVFEVGKLGPDLEVTWLHRGEMGFPGKNSQPRVRFESGNRVTLQVKKNDFDEFYEMRGDLDAANSRIHWFSTNSLDHAPAFDPTIAKQGFRTLRVFRGADGGAPAETLQYALAPGKTGRIRVEQLTFAEHQKGESEALLKDGAPFCATRCEDQNVPWALAQRRDGKVVRLWKFDEPSPVLLEAPNPPAGLPATDTLEARWYREYCESIGVRK